MPNISKNDIACTCKDCVFKYRIRLIMEFIKMEYKFDCDRSEFIDEAILLINIDI